MSLETRIISLVQSVAADIKSIYTGLAGKVDSNDLRLSDAREWSEETIIQAEAEAGTATTRRAWTSQRVRQAIAAWWNSSKGSLSGPVAISANSANGNAVTILQNGQGTALALATNVLPVPTGATNNTGMVGGLHLYNSGGTPAEGALVAGISFGRVNTGRRGALIAASQDTANGNQIGLKFYTRNLTPVSNDELNATPALHLKPDNTVVISGSVELGNAAGQIKFPAAQNASTDANTLDDYEEGTWTPAYSPTTGAFGTVTYSLQFGKYTKVGRLVVITFLLRTSAFDLGTGVGGLRISGLPFISNGTNAGAGLGACLGFATNNPVGVVNTGSTAYMEIWHRTTANGGAVTTTVAEMSSGTSSNYICGSLSYEAS